MGKSRSSCLGGFLVSVSCPEGLYEYMWILWRSGFTYYQVKEIKIRWVSQSVMGLWFPSYLDYPHCLRPNPGQRNGSLS